MDLNSILLALIASPLLAAIAAYISAKATRVKEERKHNAREQDMREDNERMAVDLARLSQREYGKRKAAEVLGEMQILLVENNPRDADLAKILLKRSPLVDDVVVVDSVIKAIEEIKDRSYAVAGKVEGARQYDMIGLDPGLNETDGMVTLEEMLLGSSGIPIMMLTSDPVLGDEFLISGARGFMDKNDLKKAGMIDDAIFYTMGRRRTRR